MAHLGDWSIEYVDGSAEIALNRQAVEKRVAESTPVSVFQCIQDDGDSDDQIWQLMWHKGVWATPETPAAGWDWGAGTEETGSAKETTP